MHPVIFDLFKLKTHHKHLYTRILLSEKELLWRVTRFTSPYEANLAISHNLVIIQAFYTDNNGQYSYDYFKHVIDEVIESVDAILNSNKTTSHEKIITVYLKSSIQLMPFIILKVYQQHKILTDNYVIAQAKLERIFRLLNYV